MENDLYHCMSRKKNISKNSCLNWPNKEKKNIRNNAKEMPNSCDEKMNIRDCYKKNRLLFVRIFLLRSAKIKFSVLFWLKVISILWLIEITCAAIELVLAN